MTRWATGLALLSLFVGCSPALSAKPSARASAGPPTLYGETWGRPENRLVARRALPPARSLNAEVALSSRGGEILVSNDPEYLVIAAALPAALYRDELAGDFRVFYHHANRTRARLTLATALTNTRALPVLLFARGLGRGTNIYPDVAGQEALTRFLGARRRVTHLATLAPGESALVGPHIMRPGETASGLGEFVAVTPPREAARASPALIVALEAASSGANADLPAGFSPAAVTVGVVAYRGTAPEEPQSLPVIPAGPPKPVDGTPYHLLNRGTFPHSDRYADILLEPAAATMLTLNSAVSGPFARALPGEYLLGTDAVSGRLGFNNGNYGVVYDLRVCALTRAPLGFLYDLLMQPAGGFGHYAYEVDGGTLGSPFVSYKNGWWFYEALAFGPKGCLSLRTHLPGGAFGPQKFFFVPFPVPE